MIRGSVVFSPFGSLSWCREYCSTCVPHIDLMTPVNLPSALAFSLAAVAAFTVILISLRCLPCRWLLIDFSCSLSLLGSEACSGIVSSFQCQGPCPHAYALILDSSVGKDFGEFLFPLFTDFFDTYRYVLRSLPLPSLGFTCAVLPHSINCR